MRILLAPDKFKDSLTAKEVCYYMSNAIKLVNPDIEVIETTLSDGGDGFLSALWAISDNLQSKTIQTVDAVGKTVTPYYLTNHEKSTAYIELAQSSGLAQLELHERNALNTSTFGTGLEIKSALNQGCKTIYLGLGGSATNDGGCGIAAALGYRFLDKSGTEFIPTALNLIKINNIIPTDLDLSEHKFIAINDVNNPLLGREGATYTYGIQKGLKVTDLEKVETGMRHLNQKVKDCLGKNSSNIPGSGAAGGTAFGMKVFLEAKFISGIEFFLENNTLLEKLNFNNLDIILTGEGRIDDQTKYGKLISGVGNLGLEKGVPVVAFCGKNDLDEVKKADLNLKDIIEILDPIKPLSYNLRHASELLTKKVMDYIKRMTSNYKTQ